ncbi:MAG: NAD(P)H-dependent oxidoreductase, partial [Actinomycetota bacterium]|nr:NAD(P)H-dependent oxidoreductase [Actinomycetota bacterium]
MSKLLRIDSSARTADSVSRQLSDRLISRIAPDADVTVRNLADGIPLLSESTLGAMWTPEADRTDAQNAELADANIAIQELFDADTIVIGLPIYNFGPPATLKAWADLVA